MFIPYDEMSGASLVSDGIPNIVLNRKDCKAWHPEYGLIYEVLEDGQRMLAAIRTFRPNEVKVRRARLPVHQTCTDAGCHRNTELALGEQCKT